MLEALADPQSFSESLELSTLLGSGSSGPTSSWLWICVPEIRTRCWIYPMTLIFHSAPITAHAQTLNSHNSSVGRVSCK